jgi:hypothetical protein
MKKFAVFLIAAMFMISIAPAYCTGGSVIWYREFNYGGNETAYGVAVDAANNVIVVGYGSNNTMVKYDSNGNKLWDQDVSSNLLVTVATDSSNNIFVGGSGGIAKFGPNGGVALASVNPGSVQDIAVDSNNNVVVITGANNIYKYNSNLNLLAGPIGSTINPLSVAVDTNNNIIVAGYQGSNNPFAVAKFDTNGNLLWANTYDVVGVNDYAYGVTVDPNNNIIATGVSGNEVITIKYSSSGSQLWAKTYKEGTYYTIGHSVVADSNGNIFVAGYFFNPPGYGNWLVIKYDSNGNFGWKNINPGDNRGYAYDITTDSNNNVVAAGYGEKDSPTYTDFFYTVKYQAEPKKKSLPIDFILKILQKNKNK